MNLRIHSEANDVIDVENSKSETHSTPEDHLLGQYIPLHYHFNMLQDQARVGAFKEAIEKVVQPGMHVLEFGGGTGILSWLAAKQGATVTCVERNPALVESARSFLSQNPFGDLVTVIQGDAREFMPTHPVDAVICEMLHVALIREKQLEVIHAFKENYRTVFGQDARLPKFLPQATTMMVQPVQFTYEFEGYYAPVPLFQDPLVIDARTTPLGDLQPYANIFYDESYPMSFEPTMDLKIGQSGSLTAFRFITQNLITIVPEEQRGVPWPNQFLVVPIREPIEVVQGETLRVQFSHTAGGSLESLIDSISLSIRSDQIEYKRAA